MELMISSLEDSFSCILKLHVDIATNRDFCNLPKV